MENHDTDEDKLLQNALLFNAIRKNKTPGKKLPKISKYLAKGADINAVDANNKHNTPLHVAVSKGEIEIVTFLLNRGATVISKNSNNQTALDIAQQPGACNGLEIANILKSYLIENQEVLQKETKEQFNVENITEQINKHQAQNQCKVVSKRAKENTQNFYQKRSGTSGLGGQLYETKLLSLILLRALHNDKINEFFLGTNVEGIGAFDDIIFRYNFKGSKKSKIIFLQAKHKEDPAKNKVTVEDVLKQNGDFSLHKYLDSYLKICQKFSPDNNDDLFKGSMKDVDCDFIIFTSALEHFTKKKVVDQSFEEYFIKTNNNGKIFQFAYDDEDIGLLVRTVSISRTVALAKRLCHFILKDNNNYKNMMMDDLIKTFHVFLAQNVISLETTPQDIDSKDTFLIGKFQQKFLTSNDDLLLLIKHMIFKEITDTTKSSDQQNKVKIQSLTFKLPVNFGNVNFCFSGTEAKKQRRLNYLCFKFKKLIQTGNELNSKYICIKLDESMIGPNEILQDTDMEMYRLGGLVGNLLTFDNETKFLMFNHDVQNLSEDNVKLLELLKKEFNDLSCFRFDINISQFPKLTLVYDEYDRNIVKDFLSKLKFYTDQAKEDKVENIVKEEIDQFCNIKQTQNESLFRIKCDAIFLKVHDKIQKWWKQSVRAPYLTATCKFYQEAQKDILESPLLSFLNIIYRENMKNIFAKFVSVTIESLKIETFLKRTEKMLVIFSNEINFSCIKLIQYFDVKDSDQGCLFLDLDFVIIENYFEIVQSELRKSKVEVLAVVCQNGGNVTKLCEKINVLSQSFQGKIIIVTNSNIRDNLETVLSENIIQEIDNNNSLNDLAGEYREMVLVERKILFQGNELSLDTLLDSESLHLVRANVMRKIINNERIEIGKTLSNPSYNAISNFYIIQRICRYITMAIENARYDGLYIIDDVKSEHVPQGIADIILVSEFEREYEDICNKYKEYNVHWFSCEGNCYVWKKSRGSLEAILMYVARGSHNSYTKRPKTLKDIDEKVVIISAEPGMGKSTLLTHLALETKRIYPTLWIAKINLLEHIDQFSKWKEDETNINMIEAIKFLYTAINTNFVKDNEAGIQNIKINFEKLVNQICIDNNNNIYLPNNENRKDFCELGLLEINLFSHYYNKNLVALLFDGFDEICPDYANVVMKLLCTLKTSKVAHLWVTTRSYNVLHQLESVLGTFSFTLKALTPCEQETFLLKIWSAELDLDDEAEAWFRVRIFFRAISFALRDDERSFTSLPLHLNMVSEIFLELFTYYYNIQIKKYSDVYIEQVMKSFNLIPLYEAFVDMKFFKIRFGEKKHFMCFKDPDMRRMVEKERKAFLENHKKIGAYFLLAKSVVKNLFSEQEIKEVHEFIENVKSGEEKSGIIERIVGDNPKFVHVTFAEYFATEFLFDKFQSELCTSALQKYVVNVIFLTDNGGVRRFINSKLIKDKKLFDLSRNKTYICTIFNTLLSQNYLPSNSFFVASEEYLDHIAMYMLICASTALTAKNLNSFLQLFRKKCITPCDLCAAKDRKLIIKPVMSRSMGTRLYW